MTLALVPIFFSGVVAVVIGFLWYHPRVFGAAWMRLSNVTPEMANASRRDRWMRAFVSFVASLCTALLLNYLAITLGVNDWIGAVGLSLALWLGFIAPSMLHAVLWERRPLALYFINSLYWLVTLIVITLMLLFT
jgi:hypothetical protein